MPQSSKGAHMPPASTVGEDAGREQMITSLLPLARRLASRYRHSGESLEDLEQVAYLGLVKAADRYDPKAGPLVSYAVPTILGELRRHFRDKGWGLRVTRSVQEDLLRVTATFDKLTTRLGRTPTARDVADATGIAIEDVIVALEAGRSYRPASLDAPIGNAASEPTPLRDTLGSTDHHYGYVELGATIAPAFRLLPDREQRIVEMRFFEDLTQSEIAERLGISQMHVSRLLRRALDQLHSAVTDVAA
jgi:RNA polymerase sigma-B factor